MMSKTHRGGIHRPTGSGHVFSRPIVTQVVPRKAFYAAEACYQNYATLHPDNPYIAFNDALKVEHLRRQFPELYKK